MTPDNKALIGRVRAKATGVKYAGWADTVAVCDLAERLAEPQADLVTTIIAEVEDWLEDYYENPPRAAKVARRIARQFTGRLLPDGYMAVPVEWACAVERSLTEHADQIHRLKAEIVGIENNDG